MKTLFVCSDKKINSHVGEEYDCIIEVQDQPTTETILEMANRIRGHIRALWMEQVKPSDPNHVVVNPSVACHLDGASPYNAMLLNLQIIMKAEEGIVIELPYLANAKVQVPDKETLDLLNKLDAGRR